MQSVKPLRLKRETFRGKSETDPSTIVNVWVDSGLSHLDGVYSYRIPTELKERIFIGSRVKVPFNSRSCEALVVELVHSEEASNQFKVIESLLGEIPATSESMIKFYALMAKYWASDPYSLVKFGIPPRVASVEKNFAYRDTPQPLRSPTGRRKSEQSFLMHSPHKSAYAQILELSLNQLKQGSTLLLLPDVKDIDRIFELISTSGHSHTVLRLDSSLPRAQRYENYLEALTMENVLVIGNRSALFAPVNNLNSIIVGFEKSEQYYEKKHPYWNVRDSALLRAEFENINIFFTGYVPSSLISRRIENREIDFIGPRSSLKTFAFPQKHGELLPDRIIPAIRKALVEGTVLFLVPRKGYGNALLCAKCRNISLCSCGGRQILTSSNADPLCSTCGNLEKDWKCKWCDSTTRYVSARGIDRLHEEIGRAFANTRIQLSSAPNILGDVAPNTKIVIATAGSVPGNKEDYSAVVLLEGQRFLAASTTVYEEQVYENFFEAASHVSKKGSVLIVLDHSHPVVAALTRWSPSILVKKILRENVEAFLPPYSSIAILTLDKSDAVVLKNGFTKSIADGRLPSQTNVVLVPGQGESQSRVLVSVPIEYRELLSTFVLELSRKRAIAKKSVVNIALDPYTLLT